MNKEFTPYQPSLELKELGFDELCFAEYRQWNGNKPWLQLYQDLSDCSTDPADYEYTTECLAPTFSQALRWFREKYNIDGFIQIEPLNKKYGYVTYDRKKGNYTESERKYNFEEAEFACLIKLIEIVKEKQ
jgi:hypothetical protein